MFDFVHLHDTTLFADAEPAVLQDNADEEEEDAEDEEGEADEEVEEEHAAKKRKTA